jgi:hypothetical protein
MDLKSLRRLFACTSDLVLAILIVITSVVIFVPIAPLFPLNTLDSGWAFAVNVAVAKGLVFGRELIFTFGPYASVYTTQYHPATDAQMLWSGGLLAISFAMSLICLTQGVYRLVALGLAVFLVFTLRDTQFFAIPFTSLLLICRVAAPSDHPMHITPSVRVGLTLTLLVVTLSLMPLVKGTFVVSSGAVMALGCLLLIERRHGLLAAAAALLFVVSMSILWTMARQPLVALPRFFLDQVPITAGYTAAMSVPGQKWQIILYVLCCLLLGLQNLRLLYAFGTAGRILLLGVAFLLFLVFKEGFVRDDTHSLIAAGMLGVAGWTMLLSGQRGFIPFVGLLVGVTGWAVIDHSETGLTAATLAYRVETPFIVAADAMTTRWHSPAQLERSYSDNVKQIRTAQPLAHLVGTTDIYSFGQSALLANNLNWAPRPVLQSYSAYTPSLARRDADYLARLKAPTTILFAVQPIDNRLPSLEDGASWPALLTRYSIIGFDGDLAVLRKRTTPTTMSPLANTPELSGIFHLGEPIILPKNIPVVWARANVKLTLWGRVMSLLFKPPHLNISYLFPDGHKQTFRYIAGMGESGFVATPVIQSTADFVALVLPEAADHFAGSRPVSLSITADHGTGWLWRSSFTAQFLAAHIPAQPGVTGLFFSPMKTMRARVADLPTTSDCSIDSINRMPAAQRPITVSEILRVDGWAVISPKNGTAPDSTVITLTAPDGTVETAQARQILRGDVNRHYAKPNMGPVGFVASADVTSLKGDYLLGLEQSLGSQTWVCRTRIPLNIAAVSTGD